MRDATDARRKLRADPEVLAYLEGVGRRVADLRERAGLTQQEAASKAGLHLTGWQKIEAGSSNPTLITLHSIADVLDVEVRRLVHPRASTRANPRRPGRPRGR